LPEDAPAPFRAAMEHTLALAEKDLAGALDLAGRLGVDVPAIALGRTTFHRTVRLPPAR
jgi:3-hydroxyisobutyrate dehydrogenase-like beta-hydroxyacid dehydrogenase